MTLSRMIVLCCSRVVRDLLASKACDMGAPLVSFNSAESATNPHRPPHIIYPIADAPILPGRSGTENPSGQCRQATAPFVLGCDIKQERRPL